MRKKLVDRRHEQRESLEPGSGAWFWAPDGESGWAKIPRTLPLILVLLGRKELVGNRHVVATYLDILARNMGEGLVDLEDDAIHAYVAGFNPDRGKRSWKERMRLLESLGFIKIKTYGPRKFGKVVVVHPHVAVQQLYADRRVPEDLWQMILETAQKCGADMTKLKPAKKEKTKVIPIRRPAAK